MTDQFELFGRRRSEAELVATTFLPARLTQARVLRRLTKTELAELVGVSPAAVGQFESGVTAPHPSTITKLADHLQVRPRFFASGRPMAQATELHAHFRSLRGTRVRDRDFALATAAQVWELVCTLERHLDFPTVHLPRTVGDAAAKDAAHTLRDAWGIGPGPVRHLTALAESHGVVVLDRPTGDIDAVDAYSLWVVHRPVIVTTPRRTDDVLRHRFTVAHELGHLMLHSEALAGDIQHEREADTFAAHLLTPTEEIAADLPERIQLAKLDQVSRKWGVSTQSLLRRMRELGRTSDASVRRAYQRLAATASFRPAEPVSGYPGETPAVLRQAITLAMNHGTPTGQLLDELGWTAAQLDELIGRSEQRPRLRLVD